MFQRLPSLKKPVRAFFSMVFAALLVASTAFSAGAVPQNADSLELVTEPEFETVVPETQDDEATISDVGPDAVEDLDLSEEQYPGDGLLGEDFLEPLAEEPTGTEALLESLATLNSALIPMAAEDGRTCSYAEGGAGAYAETLCWLDFSQAVQYGTNGSGFTTAYRNDGTSKHPTWVSVLDPVGGPYRHTVEGSHNGSWGDIKNFPVSVNLGDGYQLTATLNVRGTNQRDKAVVAKKFPTWSGAFLGNNNFYTGVKGSPALYQNVAGTGISTLALQDVKLHKGNQLVRDYAIVVADAESTDNNEGIQWETTGDGFEWLPNNPGGSSKEDYMGNACTSYSPLLSSKSKSASCTTTGQLPAKNGTPMLATAPPADSRKFNITQVLTGNGLQGVAFGVIVARTAVQVSVENRIVNSKNERVDPSNFQASVSQASDNTLIITTETGGLDKESEEVSSALPVGNHGTQLRFSSRATGELYDSYIPNWRCEKSNPETGTPDSWPSQTTFSLTPPPENDPFTLLNVGQFLKCDVTYTPPYLSLVKVVDNGDTAAAHGPEDFTLRATRQSEPVSMIEGEGNEATDVSRRPVAVGHYALMEEQPISGEAENWRYGYDWTDLKCTSKSDATPQREFSVVPDPNQEEVVAGGTLEIIPGNDITCTYTNVARQPQLLTTKQAFNASGEEELTWGTAVDENVLVSYKLTFNNGGSAPMELNYHDYLGDVLDDATFVQGSVKIADGEEPSYPDSTLPDPGLRVDKELTGSNPLLKIEGIVERDETRTVWFQVETMSNKSKAQSRQNGVQRATDDMKVPNQVGFTLNNYLLPADAPVPESCVESDVEDLNSACTHNKLNAWTIRKDSQPQDGAMIHSGGNIYYRVKVTNYSGQDLNGVQIVDNMTETLAAALWDPKAPPAVPVHYGISFYDASGQEIEELAQPWDSEAVDAPRPVYDGDPTFDGNRTDGRAFPGGWKFTTPEFNIPAEASYAIVGYVVKGGNVADPNNPQEAYVNEGTVVKSVPNALWVNTVQGGVATIGEQTVYPNRCSSESGNLPPGDYPGYYDCKVWHSLSDNYFHLWKKSAGEGPDGRDVGLNIVGSIFVLSDTKQDALEGNPSRWLCRENNNPYSSTYIAPGGDPALSGALDFGEGSETWNAINQWNIANPGDLREVCGLFYHLDEDSQGQAAGSWRAMDIRGGDTIEGSSAPVNNWRTKSALNDPGDPESGRHGTYWLVETKSPETHQLLSQPMKLWVAPSSPTPEKPGYGVGNAAWYDYQGRLSLPVVGEGEAPAVDAEMPGTSVGGQELRKQCVNPWVLPADSQPSCVMPTGWTMPIFDVKMQALPLTGGRSTASLMTGGGAALTIALLGIWLWRRRTADSTGGGTDM